MNADTCETLGGEDDASTDSGGDFYKDEVIQRILGSLGTSPYVIGDLQLLSLGSIVKDSEYFQDDRFIWPKGYTTLRKFNSIAVYKMEVLRDEYAKIQPLFRVTLDNGEQIKGSTPSACWKKIYKRMKLENGTSNSIDG
ncbi:hypothetical protein K2173_004367 [Erythroxylum novogranatense]|uniref:FYR N-terminal domain-containing protein n=1 Tax=Erythroxylum novogranatense TaxID=1862640 RepID=A0AAV8T497_9ROSI|nr:hypothetical protein K2173_004367 [Erythroxylum novogranatense]